MEPTPFCASRGIVASEAYRTRMAQNGVGSIEPEEGLAALEQLLSAPVSQLVLAKAQPRVLEAMAVSQDQITIAAKYLPAAGDSLSPRTNRVFEPAAHDHEKAKEMERLMGQLLFVQLRGLGLFDEGQGPTTTWKQQVKIHSLYDRWLDESVRVLTREGFVAGAGVRYMLKDRSGANQGAPGPEGNRNKGEGVNNANLRPHGKPLDATLRTLHWII